MITPEKIEEWIREAEERPFSGPLIIRFIASRLSDLTQRNEELLAENIELRTDRKVEDYERRIASLEYQVELLKRQLGGEVVLPEGPELPSPAVETVNLLLYTPQGQLLRLELDAPKIDSGSVVGHFSQAVGENHPRLVAAASQEELLLAFDTGRTVTLPVSGLPSAQGGALDWDQCFLQTPIGSEELAAALPIARMALFENCVQVSRRGFVKKIKESQLETYITKAYIGSGVKLPSDKSCALTLCNTADKLVLASKEGFLLTLEVERLPQAIEETIRLGVNDHVIAAFTVGQKPYLLLVTQNGKVIHRQSDWLEPASSFKTRGQVAYSQERRDAGVRVAGAAAVSPEDWAAALHSSGLITIHRVADLFSSGSIQGQPGSQIVALTTFSIPKSL